MVKRGHGGGWLPTRRWSPASPMGPSPRAFSPIAEATHPYPAGAVVDQRCLEPRRPIGLAPTARGRMVVAEAAIGGQLPDSGHSLHSSIVLTAKI
jgi:hypothetical protein